MNNYLIKGIPVSPGIASGKAFLLTKEDELIIPKYISSFDLEQARLGQAIQSLRLELNRLKEKTLGSLSEETSILFNSYLMILDNPELLKQTLTKIRDESVNVEWALENIAEQFIASSKLNASAFCELRSNLIGILLKNKNFPIEKLTEPVILVARDLTFIQVASMNPKIILGLLTESGESLRVVRIMAQDLKIPLIMGLQKITSIIKNGDQIVLDGEAGTIVINPKGELLK